jgi:hypothetical protein
MILNAFFRRDTSFYLLSVFDSRLNQDFAPSAAFNADILAMGAVKIWQGIQLLVNAFLNNPHQARHGRQNIGADFLGTFVGEHISLCAESNTYFIFLRLSRNCVV